jgi:hypothetical protein
VAKGPNEWEWQVGLTGTRQTIQYSLALEPTHQGETRVSGYQGAEPVVAKPAPESPVYKPNPVEPPWYVTRMPGGVGGVAPRGVPLSRSMPHGQLCTEAGESAELGGER